MSTVYTGIFCNIMNILTKTSCRIVPTPHYLAEGGEHVVQVLLVDEAVPVVVNHVERLLERKTYKKKNAN